MSAESSIVSKADWILRRSASNPLISASISFAVLRPISSVHDFIDPRGLYDEGGSSGILCVLWCLVVASERYIMLRPERFEPMDCRSKGILSD